MPSAANRTTWARCTKRCGWLLAFAQDCRVTRSSGDKATKGARLLMGKIIRERVKYVKLFMTHYTRTFRLPEREKTREYSGCSRRDLPGLGFAPRPRRRTCVG